MNIGNKVSLKIQYWFLSAPPYFRSPLALAVACPFAERCASKGRRGYRDLLFSVTSSNKQFLHFDPDKHQGTKSKTNHQFSKGQVMSTKELLEWFDID